MFELLDGHDSAAAVEDHCACGGRALVDGCDISRGAGHAASVARGAPRRDQLR